MKSKSTTKKNIVYQAPAMYVATFYALLIAWMVVCVVFLVVSLYQVESVSWYKVFIIVFVASYTCYFSVALSYRIEVGNEGSIRLTSFRRIIETSAGEIPIIEGPHLPIGFIKFRLEREKAYLFCLAKDETLGEVLKVIRTRNPGVKFKGL